MCHNMRCVMTCAVSRVVSSCLSYCCRVARARVPRGVKARCWMRVQRRTDCNVTPFGQDVARLVKSRVWMHSGMLSGCTVDAPASQACALPMLAPKTRCSHSGSSGHHAQSFSGRFIKYIHTSQPRKVQDKWAQIASELVQVLSRVHPPSHLLSPRTSLFRRRAPLQVGTLVAQVSRPHLTNQQ